MHDLRHARERFGFGAHRASARGEPSTRANEEGDSLRSAILGISAAALIFALAILYGRALRRIEALEREATHREMLCRYDRSALELRRTSDRAMRAILRWSAR